MVKCVCYRVPLPDEYDEEEELEKEEEEKKKLSPNLNVTGSPNQVGHLWADDTIFRQAFFLMTFF